MPARLILRASKRRGVLLRVLQAFVFTSVEAFLALLCLVSGIPVLIDPLSFARTVSSSIGIWVAYPWGAAMLFGGASTLIGIGNGNLRVERAGIAILGSVASIYAIALVGLWPLSWVSLLTYVFFALAMLARYWVLGKLLNYENQFKESLFDKLREDDK